MLKGKIRIILFLVTGLAYFLPLCGQEFSSFFIDFIRYPENQANCVQFPLKVDNTFVKDKTLYNPQMFLTRNNLPILCVDSLNAAVTQQSSISVSIVQFNKDRETATDYLFESKNKNWKLVSLKNESFQRLKDADFLNFLMQYSRDESFQMKHTIFPFPYRIYKTAKRDNDSDNRLLMPRDWTALDFTAIFPALSIFNFNTQASNRQLFVFRNGKMAQFFNFILINKKWYLIEIEEYK